MAKRAAHVDDPALLAALDKALHAGVLSLGDACRSMRARDGLTQAEFAERIGVATKVVKELEGGKGNPTLDSLNRIAAFVGMQVGFVPARSLVKLGSAADYARYIEKQSKTRRSELRALKQGRSSLRQQHARNALRGTDFTIELPELK